MLTPRTWAPASPMVPSESSKTSGLLLPPPVLLFVGAGVTDRPGETDAPEGNTGVPGDPLGKQPGGVGWRMSLPSCARTLNFTVLSVTCFGSTASVNR